MKKQERIQDLKNEIKVLKNELRETKEILKMVTNGALKWKNKYMEIKRNYINLVKEKQIFVDTKPEKIVNVEIKGDVIFNPTNSFYKSDFLDTSNIFEKSSEIKLQTDRTNECEKKNILFKKPELSKKEVSVCKKYEEISEDESSSLLQELNVDSDDDVSLQEISNNNSSNLINLYESSETLIKKKRRRKKRY